MSDSAEDALTRPMADSTPEGPSRFRVVGIGASAGGLESLEQFFEHLPARTGMAYVVIQHLSPDFRSMMDELLSRRCDMPVRLAEDQLEVEPDHVYLLPPKKEMIIHNRRLLLADKERTPALTLPIDRFFRSLAEDLGDDSVGIILSGSGSDGSRGIRDIKRVGGVVIVETPQSAKFDGMPLSAIATGIVDHCAAAKDLPRFLMEGEGKQPEALDDVADDESPTDAVLRLLRDRFGLDFSVYKTSTVGRRIFRRVELIGSSSLETYVDLLRTDPEELSALYHDLLIGVTRFFRDPEAFDALETAVIPQILSQVPEKEEIRMWVAGCATGEEAYSMAMILFEQLTAANRPLNVKILSTDVHSASLAFASAGFYAEEQLEHVSDRRRERFFTKKAGGYQISQDLRQLIVFAPHDVTKDAPFMNMHLISCRNLLIYLEPPAQKTVMSLFHFGLTTGGFLMLGSSEATGSLSNEFIVVDERWKLYRKRRDVRLLQPLRVPIARKAPGMPTTYLSSGRTTSADTHLLYTYDQLLDRYMPPSFLVDEDRHLLDSFGGAERMFRMGRRRPSTSVLDLLQGELRTVVAGAVQSALRKQGAVRYTGVPLPDGTESQRTVLSAEAFTNPRTGSSHVLITVERQAGTGTTQTTPAEDVGEPAEVASQERLVTLEGELSYARQTLQSTIEELQTSNEELQAANEELVASNEELQSTNEELHSVNEELYTVNAEYQRKIVELRELNSDMQHFLESTDVGILFLDRTLHIRKYTPRIASIFHVQPQDIGRSIRDFSHNLDRPSLQDEIERSLREGVTTEDEVRDWNRTTFFLRILPYRSANNNEVDADVPRLQQAIDGVVVSLTDISALEKARSRVSQLSAIVESSDDAITGYTLDGTITSWNRGAERLYGYTYDEAIGRNIVMLATTVSDGSCKFLPTFREGARLQQSEIKRARKDGTPVDVSVTISPILDSAGVIIGASDIARDITEKKRAEQEIRTAARRREQFLAMLSHELRNPLAAVLSAASIVRSSTKPVVIERSHQVIDRQARHMARLLDDLLDVSRITRGGIELRKEDVDLREVITTATEALTSVFQDRNARLTLDLEDGVLPVLGDPARLQQVVVNLLSNAVKYSPIGKEIRLSVRMEGDWVLLHVRDQGRGIPQEMLSEIFELFVQHEPGLERSNGGLGIGLTLVRNIVELHGGTVEARSGGPGMGSEFVVRLPKIAKVVKDAPKPQRNCEPRRIVLIEDQDDAREMLREQLEAAGHTVFEEPDGRAGLDRILQEHPDVALIDIGLPRMCGYDVARGVRENPALHDILLVALTGYGTAEDVAAAYAAGFDDHLTKPADPNAINEALMKRRMRTAS